MSIFFRVPVFIFILGVKFRSRIWKLLSIIFSVGVWSALNIGAMSKSFRLIATK